MAWIESHQQLREHPKVYRLMEALKISKAQALGHLHLFWWWCVDYAPTGRLEGFNDLQLARAGEWTDEPKMFVDALIESRFIDRSDGVLTVHDWLEFRLHYDLMLERRERTVAQVKRRVDRFRKRKQRLTDEACNAPVTQSNAPTKPNLTKPKRTKTKQTNRAESAFEDFWPFYPRRIDKNAALVKWRATIKRGAKPEDLILAAKNYQLSTNGTEERFIKHAATFLGPTEPWREYLDGPRIPESKQDLQRQKMEEMARRGLDDEREF